mgnify:CR=1 FL=1
MYEEYEKTDLKFNHISQDEDWEDIEWIFLFVKLKYLFIIKITVYIIFQT